MNEKMERVIEKLEDKGIDQAYCMLTNILDQSTKLLYVGENSREVAMGAFAGHPEIETPSGKCLMLANVVSRKKQVIPSLIRSMEEV